MVYLAIASLATQYIANHGEVRRKVEHVKSRLLRVSAVVHLMAKCLSRGALVGGVRAGIHLVVVLF